MNFLIGLIFPDKGAIFISGSGSGSGSTGFFIAFFVVFLLICSLLLWDHVYSMRRSYLVLFLIFSGFILNFNWVILRIRREFHLELFLGFWKWRKNFVEKTFQKKEIFHLFLTKKIASFIQSLFPKVKTYLFSKEEKFNWS